MKVKDIMNPRHRIAMTLYKANLPVALVAKATGYTETSISGIRQQYNIPIRDYVKANHSPRSGYRLKDTGISEQQLKKRYDIPFESLSPRAKRLVIKFGGKEYEVK